MRTLWQDLRYAGRMLSRSPGFTAVAVLSLALGIGANTTIFSVINMVRSRPLPFKEPDRLVVITEIDLKRGTGAPTFAAFTELQQQSDVFEELGLASFGTEPVTLSGTRVADRITSQAVGRNLFAALGVEPALGRSFTPDDDFTGGSNVVLISYDAWQRRFDGDQNVLGQTMRIDGKVRTIVGVMPAGFWITPWSTDADIWVGYDLSGVPKSRWLNKIGRLRPGVSRQQAEAEAKTVIRRLAESVGQKSTESLVQAATLRQLYFGLMERGLYFLLAAVSFVLLIACVNVANLLLARGAIRRKELTVRSSVGAGRRRLVRQLLTESVLLALLGGVLGVTLAVWGVDLFAALAPDWFPGTEEIRIDGWVLGYTLGLSIFTGLLFGLLPALRVSKLDLNEALKEGGGRSRGPGRRRKGNALLISEVALAMVLLMGAGVAIRSFLHEQRADPGFNPENLLTGEVFLNGPDYWQPAGNDVKRVTEEAAIFFRVVLERARNLPGVESAGMIGRLPTQWLEMRSFTIRGRPAVAPGEEPTAGYNEVSEDLFRTLDIPLLQGRYITERDVEGSPWVVVVSETFARQYFPNEDALGQTIRLAIQSAGAGKSMEEDRVREVVGIVGDLRYPGRGDTPPPVMYGSYRQHPTDYPGGHYATHVRKSLAIRTSVDPESIVPALRDAVAAVDKDQAVYGLMTMEQRLWDSLSAHRFMMRIFGLFGGLAALLAAVGIYGVSAYFVNRQTHEFGLRMALGAERKDVLRLVLKQALKPTLIGAAIGLTVTVALMTVASYLVFSTAELDPVTVAAVAAFMIGVALLASGIPARRATKVDPMTALRYE